MQIPWIEISTITVYLLFLMIVGVIFSKQNKNSDEYFKAGSKGTWWLIGTNMFMALISSYTFTGNAVGIYESGWSPMAIYGTNFLSLLVCGFGLAALYRQLRVVTIAEVLRMRFGPRTEQIMAYVFVLQTLIFAGVALYGLSIFTQRLVPEVSPIWVILAVGLIVTAYCTIGGNWGILANSFVQGLILISMTVLLAVLCFMKTGGISEFFGLINADPELSQQYQLISPVNATAGFWSVKYGVSWFLFTALTQFFSMTGVMQSVRYFAAKDGREASRASFFAAGLMAVGAFIWFIPPMASRLFYSVEVAAARPDMVKAMEFSYVIAAENLLPAGLMGLMVVAMFSASVSSLDVALNRNAAMIVRDIIPVFRRWLQWAEWSDQRQILAGKVATFFLGMVITLLALFYSSMRELSIFDFLLNVMGFLVLPIMVPMLLCLFIKKTASWAVLASMFAGFIPSVLDKVFGWGLSYQGKGFIVFFTSVAAFMISTLFYKSSPEEYKKRCEEFYTRMHRPVDFEKEIGESNDTNQMNVIGLLAVATSLLLMLLLLIPNPLSGRICILSICLFILFVGLFMVGVARFRARKA
jgi:Na+/proline symporter